MSWFRRAIAVILLLTSVQYGLVGQTRGCTPAGASSRSTIAVSSAKHHASHGESQHPGEHSRQHCLTSVNCIQLLPPDTAVQPFFSTPVSRDGRIVALPLLRSLSLQPTTPPPRS
ncbi:MAG TPA: hypothetical protein VGP80_00325 [Gemmatimonadales bacterium]|jgi:hypothetical protein|nr:hypothetical protein [Gemmatimonadales bacterium]